MSDTLVPESIVEASKMLGTAFRDNRRVRIVGSGSAADLGNTVDADMLLSTEALATLEVWEPDDLTAVVEAGMTVEALEQRLGSERQSAVLTETSGTVGGVVATGRSGWRRLRYGPTRDRMLEVTLVTGDGRVVTGGGRLVKNVTGFDLPRLATGSMGSLGLIARVCFKLWPIPEAAATVRVDDVNRVAGSTHRPLAVLQTAEGVDVYLEGTEEAVDDQAERLGGDRREGHVWPDAPTGAAQFSLRVPPSQLAEAVRTLDPRWPFVAQHGVGEVAFAADDITSEAAIDLRTYAEAIGGALVVTAGRLGIDPWGTPPSTMAVQQRLVGQFDPSRLINRGILPGGL